MATVVDFVLLGVVLAIHTLIAAVMTRFFRIRLNTRWGTVIYTVLLVPVVLTLTTMVFTGVMDIGAGVDLGSRAMVLAVMVGLPMALGATIDVLYVTPPEEYQLPEAREG